MAALDSRLVLGAVNGPRSVVVSGESAAIDELLASCEADGVRARRVAIEYPAHSSRIEEVRGELLAGLADVSPRSGTVPFVSTVTGGLLDTAELDAEYWYRGEREAIQLEAATRTLVDRGHRVLIEIGPHPLLGFALRETVDAATAADADPVAVLGSLRRGEGDMRRFAISVAEAHVHGVEVDWSSLLADGGGRRVALPTYPFDADEGDVESFARRLANLEDRERVAAAREVVAGQVAAVLGDPGAAIDLDSDFKGL